MKISIYFNQQRKRKDGMYPLYISVYRPPHRFYINSGLTSSIPFEGESFPRTEKNFRAKTSALANILDKVEEAALENSTQPIDVLKECVRKVIAGEEFKKEKNLAECIRDFAETKEGRTKELYLATADKVEIYDHSVGIGFDCSWLEGFEQDLLKTVKVNTASIHLRNIRAVVNWAIRKDIIVRNPFNKFRIKKETTQKRNLSVESIRYLMNAETVPFIARYRDLLILMFYLIGINGKDLLLAKPSQLVNGRLFYNRAKTHKLYSIKVEKEAMDIIDKYRGKKYLLEFCDKREYSNVMLMVNRHIKRIIPGLTSYYMRHSWATIAYSLMIPKDIISQALGHSTGSEVTSIYIEYDQRLVDEANRKVIDYVLGIERDKKQ